MAAFEISLLNGLQKAIGNPVFDWFFRVITHLGDAGIFWILLAVVLLCFKKTRKVGLGMGIALVFGVLLGNALLKNLVARERPFTHAEALIHAEDLLIKMPKDYSFPSGHTLASFSCATVIFAYHKKWGILAYILAALIAFSRMYLFVHFPTDILGGLVLSFACAFASIYILKRFWPERNTTDS